MFWGQQDYVRAYNIYSGVPWCIPTLGIITPIRVIIIMSLPLSAVLYAVSFITY